MEQGSPQNEYHVAVTIDHHVTPSDMLVCTGVLGAPTVPEAVLKEHHKSGTSTDYMNASSFSSCTSP